MKFVFCTKKKLLLRNLKLILFSVFKKWTSNTDSISAKETVKKARKGLGSHSVIVGWHFAKILWIMSE